MRSLYVRFIAMSFFFVNLNFTENDRRQFKKTEKNLTKCQQRLAVIS